MFKLPSQAYIHKEVPLRSVWSAISADKALKERSKNVQKVYIEYVFSQRTTNLSSNLIKEIHFYRIELSDFNVPEDLILALDKKDKAQVVFVLIHDDMELNRTAPKRINDAEVGKTKYASSEWRKTVDDVELPNADSLDEFYLFIYGSFNPYKPFRGELLEDYIKRSNELKKLDYQIGKTEKAIQFEKQSKKRLEYNHNLNAYKERREYLLDQRRIENGKIEDAIRGLVPGEHRED